MRFGNKYRLKRHKSDSVGQKRGMPKLNITFRGHEGRWWRRGAIAIAVVVAIIIAAVVLKPETQIMNSVEINRVENRGILIVGVRNDVVGFCLNGRGIETELAELLAKRILPNADDPLKLVVCSSKTVSTKISDGSVDVAIALLPNGQSASYSYSYPYYTDNVYVLTLDNSLTSRDLTEMKLGCVQSTASQTVFKSYQSVLSAVQEQGLIDKLLGHDAPAADESTIIDIKYYGAYDDMLSALVRGDIDGVVMQGAFMRKYSSKYSFFTHDTILGTVDYCIVSSSDEPAFTQLADIMIYEMQQDGSLAALLAKYGL